MIAPDLRCRCAVVGSTGCSAGGELVTVLLGAGAGRAGADGLAADLRRTHPEVDVVVHRGGQAGYPLVLGVE